MNERRLSRLASVPEEHLPTSIEAQEDVCARQPSGVGQVGESRHSHKLTDSEREAAIERAARAIERHMAAVHEANNRVPHVFSDFADASASRWMANEARRLMNLLIAGRKKD